MLGYSGQFYRKKKRKADLKDLEVLGDLVADGEGVSVGGAVVVTQIVELPFIVTVENDEGNHSNGYDAEDDDDMAEGQVA